jgi:hypothetical protein
VNDRPGAGTSAAGSIVVGLLLFLAGIGYGAWATWLVPERFWGGVEGLSLLITALGNLGVGVLSARALRSPRAALLPVAGWFVTTATFSLLVGPGGDIVIPGGLPSDPGVVVVGELNWLLGLVSAGLAVFVGWRRLVRPSPPPGSTG